MSDRQPYVPPTLTRVVLEPTQAVLSPCSTSGTSNSTSGTTFCNTGGAFCKKASRGESPDSGAQS